MDRGMKMRINLEHVVEINRFMRKLNQTPLQKLEIYMDDKEIVIDPEKIEEWRFTGLSNLDFLRDIIEGMEGDEDEILPQVQK
jgi:hypothetical protein